MLAFFIMIFNFKKYNVYPKSGKLTETLIEIKRLNRNRAPFDNIFINLDFTNFNLNFNYVFYQ